MSLDPLKIYPDAGAPLQTTINWKVKYTLPVTYPGNQSDSVQIAWESNEPAETPYSWDLVDDARSRGLLIQNFVPLGPPQQSVYVKVQWTTGRQHPSWEVVLQLGFTVPLSLADPDAFRSLIMQHPRPRQGIF